LHDAIQFEAKGIPSALIITEPFRPIVAGFAPTIGAAGFIGCEVPHPVSTQNEAALRVIAARVADAVIAQLSA
jgi:hypothetical protein